MSTARFPVKPPSVPSGVRRKDAASSARACSPAMRVASSRSSRHSWIAKRSSASETRVYASFVPSASPGASPSPVGNDASPEDARGTRHRLGRATTPWRGPTRGVVSARSAGSARDVDAPSADIARPVAAPVMASRRDARVEVRDGGSWDGFFVPGHARAKNVARARTAEVFREGCRRDVTIDEMSNTPAKGSTPTFDLAGVTPARALVTSPRPPHNRSRASRRGPRSRAHPATDQPPIRVHTCTLTRKAQG
jgi:hypothetical protein